MDELALLKDFRLEDAASNDAREHAGAALRVAIAREQRRKQQGVAALGLVAAAILTGTAYGVVQELVVGDPAPREVREQPARFGHSAELIPVPHPEDPRLEEARVAAVLDSSVGTTYLFSSRNADGPCGSTWIEGDRGYEGRLNMSSVCGPGAQSFYAFAEQRYGGSDVQLFFGRAGDELARVALRFGSGTAKVPLSGRWFLAEFSERPYEFLSYDAEGRIVEKRDFPPLPGPVAPVKQPKPVTPLKELARIRVLGGSEEVSLLVAPSSSGGYCQAVRSDQRRANEGCSVARPKARQIGVSAMNFGGGAPDGILLLVGPVGTAIETLMLRYEDDRTATVPQSDGWVLYEVERADYARGMRPETLVGLDADGREIAAERLPWASVGG